MPLAFVRADYDRVAAHADCGSLEW